MIDMCLKEGCSNKPEVRGFCKKHYRIAARTGKIETKVTKRTKLCNEEGCTKKHFGKGKCTTHYQQLPEAKVKASLKAKETQKTEKRKEQKRRAQSNYTLSNKGAYSRLLRMAKKKKKECSITIEEYEILKLTPCLKCNGPIEITGVGLLLVNKRKDYTKDNVEPTCKVCQLIKPKEKFDPIVYAKSLMRRYWRRTPMAMIALQKAKRPGGWECAICKQVFKKGEFDLDHIKPAISVEEGFKDLNSLAISLYCDDSNLQVLCKEHHKQKTAEENKSRK